MPKKTWSKVVEEDMRKLNITGDMAEDRKQWKQLLSCPTTGVGLETVKEDDDLFQNVALWAIFISFHPSK